MANNVRLVRAEFETAVKYLTMGGFVNSFPITFEYSKEEYIVVQVGFKIIEPTEYVVETVQGIPTVVFTEDLPVGVYVTLRSRSDSTGVPHTYHFTGNAKGQSEFNQKTMDENFEYLDRIVEEVNDSAELTMDSLARFEDTFEVVQSTSEEAIRIANAASSTATSAKDIAEGIDAKATQALNTSEDANNTALGIEGIALDASRVAGEAKDIAEEALDKATEGGVTLSELESMSTGSGNWTRMSEVQKKADTTYVNTELDKKRGLSDNNFTGRLVTTDGLNIGEYGGPETVVYHRNSKGAPYVWSQLYNAGYDFPSKGGTLALTSDVAKKWDIQTTMGNGNIARMSEVQKKADTTYVNTELGRKRDLSDNVFRSVDYSQLTLFNTGMTTVGARQVLSNAGGWLQLVLRNNRDNVGQQVINFPTTSGTIALISDIPANQQIGVGQKWVNVTSQRAPQTTYTNNTGKPIQICVKDDTGSRNKNLTLVVNGTVMDFSAQSGDRLIINQIIPTGASYSLDGSHNGWWELR